MSDSLISVNLGNVGDLGLPARALVEKVSAAVGTWWEPKHMVRMARAEAEVARLRAEALELSDTDLRALKRLIAESRKTQANADVITTLAIENLAQSARPDLIDDDWVSHFYDKCRIVSDEDMQTLWAKLLAGEANVPGTYTRRTFDVLANMSKDEADDFTSLCQCCWKFEEDLIPVILRFDDPVHTAMGLHSGRLEHLDDAGLVNLTPHSRIVEEKGRSSITAQYFDCTVTFRAPEGESPTGGTTVSIGHVVLTKVGRELAPLSGAMKSDRFFQHCLSSWEAMGQEFVLSPN